MGVGGWEKKELKSRVCVHGLRTSQNIIFIFFFSESSETMLGNTDHVVPRRNSIEAFQGTSTELS